MAGVAVVVIGAIGLGFILIWQGGTSYWERRNGSASPEAIAFGETLYSQNCATCHGAGLEGQPNWQQLLPSGRLPAPPHDGTGHTWHHPDQVLFEIVQKGTAAVVGGGYESNMPGFEGVLTDEEIRAVLAFIKSRWPERERAYQERMTRQDQESTS